MRYDVVLDSFNDYFPHDTTPVSLTGVKEIRLSNCQFNGIQVTARLIGYGNESNEDLALTEDGKTLSIMHEANKAWGGLLFVAHNIPEGERAFFSCDLIYS